MNWGMPRARLNKDALKGAKKWQLPGTAGRKAVNPKIDKGENKNDRPRQKRRESP